MSKPEVGSLDYYKQCSGGFVNNLIRACQTADEDNRERLKLAFPQVVAALEMSDWDKAPPGYPPEYNALEGDPDRKRWVERARKEYPQIEIDFDDQPAVSMSEEGAYVAAWVWVPRKEVEEEVASGKDPERVVQNPTG